MNEAQLLTARIDPASSLPMYVFIPIALAIVGVVIWYRVKGRR